MPKPQEFSDITLCLTMGGRPDLLEQSLKSIQEKWQFAQVVAINDFADPRCDDVFKSIYPNGVLLSDGIKRGHHGAIGKADLHHGPPSKVRRNPSSNATCGRQPNTRAAFEISSVCV